MFHSKCHTIHASHQHLSWCRDHAPVTTVAPGDTLEFGEMDAVCGQLSANSTTADLAALDFGGATPSSAPFMSMAPNRAMR